MQYSRTFRHATNHGGDTKSAWQVKETASCNFMWRRSIDCSQVLAWWKAIFFSRAWL